MAEYNNIITLEGVTRVEITGEELTKLEADRTSNMESATKNINKYDRAMGSIKKTRNSLKNKIATSTAKEIEGAKAIGIFPQVMDIETLNNMEQTAKELFDIDNKGFEDFKDYKEDYLLEKGKIDPRDFLRDLEDEIEYYEGLREQEKTRYKKWVGQGYKKSTQQLKDVYKNKFADLVFGQEVEIFNYRDGLQNKAEAGTLNRQEAQYLIQVNKLIEQFLVEPKKIMVT